MIVPTGFVNQAQLEEAVNKARCSLGPEVVRLKHSIGTDTSGDPAIFFRIVLADSAVYEDTLADVTDKVATTLFEEIRLYKTGGWSNTSASAVTQNRARIENGLKRQWPTTMIF